MTDKTKQTTKQIIKIILKLLVGLLVLGLVIAGVILILHFGFHIELEDLKNQEKVQEFIESKDPYSSLIFILISFLQVTFVPIPGAVTILAGNYLFGTLNTFIFSYIGMLLGSIVAFLLGRLIGRRFVNWVVGSKEKVDEYLKKLKGKETVLLFFMFLLPLFPDDALCAVAGITPMTWFTFIIMQLITRFTSVGGTLLFMSGEVIPYNAIGITILVIVGILAIGLFIIAYRYADKINAFLENISLKITNFFKRKKKEDVKEEKEEK